MKIKQVAEALERFAPLPLQESYDNAGLQIGLTEAEVSRVLLCLDVTEDVIEEAAMKGCQLIVCHHPLLFRGVKCVSDSDMVQRCVRLAVKKDIAIYAAHTNLDNAEGGVNWMIAEKMGLRNVRVLLPAQNGGSGAVGELPMAEAPLDFLQRVKEIFHIDCLMANHGPERKVRTIAFCGGAGDFLLDEAVRCGADVFLTGEMHYHQYFGYERQLWIGTMGHYQSEQFTVELFHRLLEKAFPTVQLIETERSTNPIQYL